MSFDQIIMTFFVLSPIALIFTLFNFFKFGVKHALISILVIAASGVFGIAFANWIIFCAENLR